MKKTTLSLLFISITVLLFAQDNLSILTWNIKDLGRTKGAEEIEAMARIMRDYDLIAIQEVVAKDPAGAQKVAAISELLNRMGDKWDYRISDPTQSPSPHIRERYAYLWKTSKLNTIEKPYLDEVLASICDREPYIAQFKTKDDHIFYTVNFHSRPYNKHPEWEVATFANYTERLASSNVIILGDFNMNEEHEVWEDLYAQGFQPAIRNTATTLKRQCTTEGVYVNHAIDNIYFNAHVFQKIESGRIDFVGGCDQLEKARAISDHLPVYVELEFKE
ncbi:MAG: endonuclease/exonuclease/phosphatase family protein [Bacteroidota bacterium]